MSIYDENHDVIMRSFIKSLPYLKSQFELYGMEEIVRLARQAATNLHESEEYKAQASCSKGCSFCCHDKIFVTKFEAATIRKYLGKHNIPVDLDLLKKQKKSYHKLSWADKRCTLLSKDGTCSIYEERPMICRTHNSLQDPKDCDRSINARTVVREIGSEQNGVFAVALAYFDMGGEDVTKLNLKSLAQLL